MRAHASCFALLMLTVCAAACEKSPTGQSDLAANAREVTSGNTKNSAVVGGNNAPADDAGAGVTAEQADAAGVMLDACAEGTRNCGEAR